MKTALQELIEDLQDMCPDYYKNNYNWLHNLLDKEKQQRNSKKCYHPLTERKHTSDTHFECTICGYNNY